MLRATDVLRRAFAVGKKNGLGVATGSRPVARTRRELPQLPKFYLLGEPSKPAIGSD